MLAGLERLRAWAMALADEEVFASWERKGLGGQTRKILHLDSAMCWDSCRELCEDGVRLRQDMAIIKDYMPDLPELLTEEDWTYIEAHIFLKHASCVVVYFAASLGTGCADRLCCFHVPYGADHGARRCQRQQGVEMRFGFGTLGV